MEPPLPPNGPISVQIYINKDKLPDFKPTFPKFKPANLKTHFKSFDETSLDLCMKLLALDPAKRISMKEALKHPYFSDLLAEDIAKYQV